MVFSSTIFLFLFLPVTLLGYFAIPKAAKNYWLLLVSLVFFAWSQPKYLWLILLSIVLNYTCAILIDSFRKLQKPLIVVAVIANLSLLFYFKYLLFALDTVNRVFGINMVWHEIVLPIGISFFTFQGMSYVIDVYRNDVRVQKNPFKTGLYIALFPQLIAGPIVRYTDVAAEIDSRSASLTDFCAGIERFITGLAKKAIIANSMAFTVDSIWAYAATENTMQVAWLAGICYTLQIYFDFSGYSDMAIGLGRMFGFHFNENFNLPYISRSITEFWRRWHISLSSWFRDYVYIPLGGNRKHVYLNLVIVFLLTGAWHGAAWNFILWGMWHGFFMLAERVLRRDHRIPAILSHAYTLLVVNTGWVLFRAPDLKEAALRLSVMFGLCHAEQPGFKLSWFLDRWTLFILVCGVFFASSVPGKLYEKIRPRVSDSLFVPVKYFVLLVLLCLSIMRVVAGTYNPFIYFQF